MSTAANPPKGQCSQCWQHAYTSREAHKGLGPREDCPACVDHMVKGHPDHMIVK
ncbi:MULTISPECIES: pRL2-8 [unclassified Streptomyces]|uniref:pRL2-8 n=1 Tax=unclassified Streptomyces TaxID=2593676 RepID=UPI000B83C6C9|nr:MULTISPECIES: pRL2-8 [unclassified Streptomyces]